MKAFAFAALACLLLACATPDPPVEDDETWVGTITTEGDVTTVINESGSVWGGTARLVEEASIGVESGPDEYMLDQTSNVSADGRRIYVVNPRVPVVRIYDYAGGYIGDLGGRGRGPGEYEVPVLIAAVDDRRFVYDTGTQRINVYSADGISIDTWPVPVRNFGCCGLPMLASTEGRLWAPVVQWAYQREEAGADTRYGVQVFGPSGGEGNTLWQPLGLEVSTPSYQHAGRQRPVPFAAAVRWGIAGPGSMVGGVPDRYRFQVHRSDGSTRVVERYWDPVPVPAEHGEWRRKRIVAQMRETADPEWDWNGDGIPAFKPAFTSFVPTASGKLWVIRPGRSERIDECVEDAIESGLAASDAAPCWTQSSMIDVFAEDGRYLGDVEVPDRLPSRAMSLLMFVRDRLVVMAVEDEAGTIMVKRYRLVLPGEE